jgi:hypothetical protein
MARTPEERHRQVRRLMRALTESGETVIITESGEISAQPRPAMGGYDELVAARQHEYDIITQRQRELFTQWCIRELSIRI